MSADPTYIRYRSARPYIEEADLLLFRRNGLISRLGRGIHSHAAKAAWWYGDLFCLEVREWVGGRAVTLSSQVARFPGRIDVYRPNPEGRWRQFSPAISSRYMRRLCGSQYGYLSVLAAGLLHLPGLRLLVPVDRDDESNSDHPPFCSQACAQADRIGGGVDPVLGLADRLTEPADLARSPFYQYAFTLIP